MSAAWLPSLVVPVPALVVGLVWFIAQTLKIGIAVAQRRHSLATYVAPGGMPSVHSAVVAALCTVTLLADGYRSTTFALAVTLAALVLFDALVVRREVGRQAEAINRLEAELTPSEVPDRLREILGHRPVEVLVGLLLGTSLALLLSPR